MLPRINNQGICLKKSNKNMKKIFISLLFTILLLNSCSEKVESPVVTSNTNDRLVFNSSKDLVTTISKTLSMSLIELKEMEEAKGFKSFGRECDEIYSKIVVENFKSKDELLKFVNDNGKYIQLIVENGDTSIETRYNTSVYRYIMNSDKMYQVDKIVFKELENGVVSTSINNIEELKNINDDNVLSFQSNSNFHVILNTSKSLLKSTNGTCGDYSEFSTNGNERVVLKLSSEVFYDYPLGVPYQSYLQFHYQSYAQKRTLGIWITAGRTITANFDATMQFENHKVRFVVPNAVYDGKVEKWLIDWDFGYGPMYGIPFDPYFTAYNCHTHIPKPCDNYAICN
jgi:hypothetical protein